MVEYFYVIMTLVPSSIAILLLFVLLHVRHRLRSARAQMRLLEEENRKDRIGLEATRRDVDLARGWSNLFRDRSGDLILVYEYDASTESPGPFCDVNEAACTRLMYTRERLLALSIIDIEAFTPAPLMQGKGGLKPVGNPAEEIDALTEDVVDRHMLSQFRARMRHLQENEAFTYECILLSRNGIQIPVEVESRLFENGEQSFVVLVARDLTEREEAREALVQSERRSRDYFVNAAIGAAIFDGKRELIDVNRIALKMLGVPDPGEFAAFNPLDNPFMPDEARKNLARGTTVRYESEIDFDVVRERGLFVSSRHGVAHFDILVTNLGMNQNYEPKGSLVQIQDITRRRAMEEALAQSERQLRQAQKMQAIGTLAGGIAHDFNNILTPILGYSEMAAHMSEDVKIKEFLDEVTRASLRAKELANQILTFSRQAEPEGKPIRIAPIVKEVFKLQQASVPDTIDIRLELKSQQDVVVTEPSQIHQILMNLCTNAAHAMEGKQGVMEIMLTDFMLGKSASREFPQLDPGRYLRISISDTGSGMDSDTADRIFEPFFTTKERGEGTGMGLAVVHGIVSSLKGTITLDTKLGEGSTFHVILPVVDSAARAAEELAPEVPHGQGCILFVDDELEIVKLQSHVLASLGYQPVLTDKSEEALRLYRRSPDRFDLVITDQVMPEMSGIDLARHIHEINPSQPIILCTGFSEAFTREQVLASGIREVLLKPVTRHEFALTIRKVIEDHQRGTTREPAGGDET